MSRGLSHSVNNLIHLYTFPSPLVTPDREPQQRRRQLPSSHHTTPSHTAVVRHMRARIPSIINPMTAQAAHIMKIVGSIDVCLHVRYDRHGGFHSCASCNSGEGINRHNSNAKYYCKLYGCLTSNDLNSLDNSINSLWSSSTVNTGEVDIAN